MYCIQYISMHANNHTDTLQIKPEMVALLDLFYLITIIQ